MDHVPDARKMVAGLALVAALTACAAPAPPLVQRIYVPQEIPPSLLTCAPWPAPAVVPTDVKGLAAWLARAKPAHADCADRLARVNELVRQDAREK